MARIISTGKNNPLKSLWRRYKSLDLFTRLFIITIILLAITTPFVAYNYQLYNAYGQSQTQRLQAIAQLQESQKNLQDVFTRPSISPVPTTTSNSAGGFSLIDTIYKMLVRITQIFN